MESYFPCRLNRHAYIVLLFIIAINTSLKPSRGISGGMRRRSRSSNRLRKPPLLVREALVSPDTALPLSLIEASLLWNCHSLSLFYFALLSCFYSFLWCYQACSQHLSLQPKSGSAQAAFPIQIPSRLADTSKSSPVSITSVTSVLGVPQMAVVEIEATQGGHVLLARSATHLRPVNAWRTPSAENIVTAWRTVNTSSA